jgi:hypothetical protein
LRRFTEKIAGRRPLQTAECTVQTAKCWQLSAYGWELSADGWELSGGCWERSAARQPHLVVDFPPKTL